MFARMVRLQAVAWVLLTGVAAGAGEVPVSFVREALAAQMRLMDAAALSRLADDWAKTWPDRATEAAAVRAFAETLDARRAAALAALGKNEVRPARLLLRDQRRVMAAHPLVRDLRILAVRHTEEGVTFERDPEDPGKNVYKHLRGHPARQDPHPALPTLSCYNNLDVEKTRPAALVVLTDFARDAPAVETLLSGTGTIHSVDLDFDASRVLFVAPDPARAQAWRLFSMPAAGGTPAALLPEKFIHEAADGCWLPDGKIVFTSDAGEQGLPCESGRVKMSNAYRLDPRTGKVDRLTYDQDSNWYPSVLNDGRVQYVRWEYCDLSHFFSRIVMTMNPDGTRQMGFYGSNAYWPNHFGHPLAIPGDNGKFVCVATGHHTPKAGKLALFDAERAQRGAAGCVQMIPGWGKPPDAKIMDRLYLNDYPRYLQPFPLGTQPADGAGRYFLTAMKPSPHGLWGIYLVDVFDNVTLLFEEEGWCFNEPIALRARVRPPALADRRRDNVPYATMYVGDIYQGEGLRGVPRGTVRRVRLFAYHYAFHHTGSHQGVGVESSWDMKYVLGTVPVTPEGSVIFEAPVNTPISIQPLDEEGAAIQLMRSWTVGMPGEYVSCLGCHENPSVTARPLAIVQRAPDRIVPDEGRAKPRTWNFLREIQPILQRRCAGCHDRDACAAVRERAPDKQGVLVFSALEHDYFLRGDKPNLADWRPMAIQMKTPGKPHVADGRAADYAGAYAKSYFYLSAYVRRPGPESDNRLANPMEYHASTSPLVQMLKAGHHGVELAPEEWRRLYTWIDLNVPFWGTWSDQAEYFRMCGDRGWAGSGTNGTHQAELLARSHARRIYAEKNFQGFWNPENDPERDRYSFGEAAKDLSKIAFEPPKGGVKKPSTAVPALPEIADLGARREVAVPGGTLAFRKVAGSLWMGETELPLAHYLAFDRAHYNGFVDWVGKDHDAPGDSVMAADHPVIRVSFDEGRRYAAWLSEKTRRTFRLPTEAEWEAAARAGEKGLYAWGGRMADFATVANLSDRSVEDLPNQFKAFNYHLRFMGADDGARAIARVDEPRYRPNGAGLRNMIGNVEEWCAGAKGEAVARGGAFDTLPRRATFLKRAVYLPYQRVYNVGLRLVLCEP